MIKDMERVFKFGLIRFSMRDSGKRENIMERELLHGIMEIDTREILLLIKNQVMEYWNI